MYCLKFVYLEVDIKLKWEHVQVRHSSVICRRFSVPSSLHFLPQWLSHYLFADLLHITGIGHGASGLGVGFQHTPPPEPEPRRPAATSTMGSDILDSNSHELKLEKSNILLLGPTGSGL
jgi:hypothetical protein